MLEVRALCATAVLVLSGCYGGVGIGPTIPVGKSHGESGSTDCRNCEIDAVLELGMQYDFYRRVRVAVGGSSQMFGGARVTYGEKHAVVPLPLFAEADVTALRWDDIQLRATVRGYYSGTKMPVRVGPIDHEVREIGSRAYGEFFGATLYINNESDDRSVGPAGLFVSAGLLASQVRAPSLRRSFVAPMVFIGGDLFLPKVLYCTFIDIDCEHYLLRATK
jgi:hypothetical protein